MRSLLISSCLVLSFSAFAQLSPVASGVYKWNDFPVKKSTDRESRAIMEGTSAHFEYLEMHATTQYPGAKPSTAHANEDIEECIIVKEGTMEVTVEGKSTILEKGGVLLLMPQQMHSLQNIGSDNLTYYVMRYRARKPMDLDRGKQGGGTLTLHQDSLTLTRTAKGSRIAYFDRPTAMCDRFSMHVTRLNARGPSHAPHQHDETEIIMMISGNTKIMIDGKEYHAQAGDFYFMESQMMHGVSNTSDEPCMYFAYKWK